MERIDFETYVDWHENHCILKAEFPFNITMNKATYEIQFGNIERVQTATHLGIRLSSRFTPINGQMYRITVME